MEAPILSVAGVTKRFGGLAALRDVSFEVRPGEVVGLMGPNGAGKTTLLNVIAGECTPGEGRVTFQGRDITRLRSDQVCRLGVGRTFQIPQPFVTLTARENLLVAAEFGRGTARSREQVEPDRLLDLVGLGDKKDVVAGNLPTLSLKQLELARALAGQPALLLLDEVAAGTTEAEVPRFLHTVAEIRRMGISVLIIEHVMKVLVGVVDRIVVLDKGTKIAEGDPNAVFCDERVVEAYFGA